METGSLVLGKTQIGGGRLYISHGASYVEPIRVQAPGIPVQFLNKCIANGKIGVIRLGDRVLAPPAGLTDGTRC